MLYNFHYPIIGTIDADTFNNAIKRYVKLNRHYNIQNLIISDQMKRYRTAMIKNYVLNGSKRAKIRTAPYQPFNYPILLGKANNTNKQSPVLFAPNFGINMVGDPMNYPFIKM